MAVERLTFTVTEVAEILGLSRSKTYELVATGEIPVLAIPGRRKLVARATVRRLLGEPDGRGSTARGPGDDTTPPAEPIRQRTRPRRWLPADVIDSGEGSARLHPRAYASFLSDVRVTE